MSSQSFPIAETVSDQALLATAFITGMGLDAILRKICASNRCIEFEGKIYAIELNSEKKIVIKPLHQKPA